jgi:amino acid transporter
LLLGYSRILFAAARDGYFFRIFGQLHPKKSFPHVSLLLIGAIAVACSFFPLDLVINVLLTTRILVQFVGQIGAVALLRKHRPGLERPYRIYLYPLPALIALVGWIYLFVTNEPIVIGIGLATIAVGVGAFLLWSWRNKTWPFALSAETTKTTT